MVEQALIEGRRRGVIPPHAGCSANPLPLLAHWGHPPIAAPAEFGQSKVMRANHQGKALARGEFVKGRFLRVISGAHRLTRAP